MSEIGKAFIAYENTKGYLPGYINPPVLNSSGVIADPARNWAKALLPYMGREDLWTGSGGTGWQNGLAYSGTAYSVYVKQFVCPDDSVSISNQATATIPCPLSYVVNSNVFINRSTYTTATGMTISQLHTAQQTMMLGEFVTQSAAANATKPMSWAGATWPPTQTITWTKPYKAIPGRQQARGILREAYRTIRTGPTSPQRLALGQCQQR